MNGTLREEMSPMCGKVGKTRAHSLRSLMSIISKCGVREFKVMAYSKEGIFFTRETVVYCHCGQP